MTSEDNNEVLVDEQDEQDGQEVQEEPSDRGPGHLLEKKREALGLSVQEAADALHITMHYVRALETDAHDKLPGDVFIKGYLRAYANLLELDPTVLINVYNEYTNQRESADLALVNRRRRQRNRNMPWIIVSGIAFVAVAIALWYFSSGSSTPLSTGAASPRPATSVAATSAQSVNTQSVSPGVPVTLDQVATTREVPTVSGGVQQIVLPFESKPVLDSLEVELPAEDLMDVSALEVDASLQASAVEQPAEPGDADALLAASDALAKADDAFPADADSAAVPAPAETTLPSLAQSERLIRVDAGGQDVLQLRFSGESMVQVQDASDEQIYRDVRVAGDVLRISGTAPFNILLGDASQSSLSLNGEDIDFSASIRIDNSARLTIGL